MSNSARLMRFELDQAVQRTAVVLLILLTLAGIAACVGAAAGIWPWIELPVAWDGTSVPWAGMAAQIGLTVLLTLFALTLPLALRVMSLERTHRDFAITMSDVAEAYALCHAADRQGVFTLSREYDAVRERIEHMRRHPRLASLEPAVLTAAAQMSTAARDLAETYSDEALMRARGFLEERQHEIARFQSQIDEATSAVNQLRRWVEAVELDEAVCESQLAQLDDQMAETMEKLGVIRAARRPAGEPVRLRRAAE